jgi:hypothetical protein
VSELLSDVLPASAEEAWVAYSAVRLYRVYGAGTFIAVLEDAVIDWDADSDALRSRIANSSAEGAFIGPVPADPMTDRHNAQASERHRILRARHPYRRRLLFGRTRFYDVTGLVGGDELLDGIVYTGDTERRYCEHDYRLLIKHDLIPRETILLGGIIFWSEPQADLRAWLPPAD